MPSDCIDSWTHCMDIGVYQSDGDMAFSVGSIDRPDAMCIGSRSIRAIPRRGDIRIRSMDDDIARLTSRVWIAMSGNNACGLRPCRRDGATRHGDYEVSNGIKSLRINAPGVVSHRDDLSIAGSNLKIARKDNFICCTLHMAVDAVSGDAHRGDLAPANVNFDIVVTVVGTMVATNNKFTRNTHGISGRCPFTSRGDIDISDGYINAAFPLMTTKHTIG